MADDGYMMAWGGLTGGRFTFKITSAAYQKMQRTDTWRWVTQERFNNDPAEQYVGRGSKVIKLEGVIYAAYNPGAGVAGAQTTAVGTHQLDLLRYYADQGTPKTFVDGRGNVLGNWVLVGMSEDAEFFLVNGAPQKQSFSLEFRLYGDDGGAAEVEYKGAPPVGDAAPASIASQLQSDGQTADQAAANGKTMDNIASQYGNGMAPYTSQIAEIVGTTWGLADPAEFAAAANALAAQLANNGYADADSLMSTGIPALDRTLSAFGIQDSNAALNVLATIASVPQGTTDRGGFLASLGAQMDGTANNPALKALGVDFNNQAVPAVDRMAVGLNTLSGLKTSNPTGLEAALPAADNAQLNGMTTASGDGAFDVSRNTIQAAGVTPSTPVVVPGAH